MPMFMAMKMARLIVEKRDLGLVNFSGYALIKITKRMWPQGLEKLPQQTVPHQPETY